MIEFALLFGLGFVTAVLIVFLISPAVHRRIVWFTEKRLKATMPLSPQEVRAQKDMARALYAAENAKTEQALTHEREKGVAMLLRQEEITRKAAVLAAENSELQSQINDMDVEAGDLRSRLRREETMIGQLKSSLQTSEQSNVEKEADLDGLRKRLNKVMSDADNLRIDLATRETEIESLKVRLQSLREERDTMRQEMEETSRRAKDAEQRLDQEERKTRRLEERLSREIAGNADKETAIERRMQDVARLKEKLKAANAEAREAGRTLRAAGLTPGAQPARAAGARPATGPRLVSNTGEDGAVGRQKKPPRDVEAEISGLTEEARNRSNALSDRLLKTRSPAHDQAMREEIATIAAQMVALTALKEGEQSPILKLLPKDVETGQGGRVNLARRAGDLLSE